jgi:repressor LexA
MMKEISGKQRSILAFINEFIERHGYSPSVREVAENCDINSSTVAQYHLNILEREGYINRSRKVFRSIALRRMRAGVTTIPIMGTIAAGVPIPVPGNDTWAIVPEEMLEVPGNLTRGLDNVYALRVKGTSMIDALIDDGDIVLLQQPGSVEDGTTVAVWLKDRQEVTLKKIYREENRICFKPANKLMKPIYCQPEDVEIQGKVIGVIRAL